ncbi:UDP-2,3-diacylglucosamine diphosphatase [Pararhodobacter sp.]|uniref:UDP-2,3-diacylglucosamine diphosphatase n=1 Tax=Pararhodobacter sp. TaxID=2127056 RepID=UPI002FDDFB3F
MPFDRFCSEPPAPGRTLFLSDLHLGALGSRSDLVLDFLQRHPARTYVLVGDVLDLWQPLLPHWTPADQAVIDHLNQRWKSGARLVYVRGNHDPDPACAPDHARLAVTPVPSYRHRAGDGRRYLVVHGDEADSRLIRTHLMTRLGSRIDHALRRLDQRLRRIGRSHDAPRSTVEWLIKAANGMAYAGRSHERRMVEMARAEGVDGVICGHFHIAGLHDRFGLTYANCGDWVDSMTALEDSGDGVLRLLGGRRVVSDLVAQPDGVALS